MLGRVQLQEISMKSKEKDDDRAPSANQRFEEHLYRNGQQHGRLWVKVKARPEQPSYLSSMVLDPVLGGRDMRDDQVKQGRQVLAGAIQIGIGPPRAPGCIKMREIKLIVIGA